MFDVLVPPINHCMYSTFKRERENRVRKTEGQSIFCLTVRSSSRDKGLHATLKVSFMYFFIFILVITPLSLKNDAYSFNALTHWHMFQHLTVQDLTRD